ncbi:MAG TPA: electron transport complex subunit RsxE, partial [Firmicutes bacterium]|nr:electron transport complex subunit RsxE [Bacillota bacterium]
ATSLSVSNGIGMGLAATVVLVGSNAIISALRNVIPDKVRIPAYIVVIAAFVTIVDKLMAAFVPSLHSVLGIF